MSSTARGAVRKREDYYPTPGWCVRRLLEATTTKLDGKRWLEPGAGMGHIIRAAQPLRPRVHKHIEKQVAKGQKELRAARPHGQARPQKGFWRNPRKR